MKKCNLCEGSMTVTNATSPGGKVIIIGYCRRCDRRQCKACNHYEQNVFAKRCTNCSGVY